MVRIVNGEIVHGDVPHHRVPELKTKGKNPPSSPMEAVAHFVGIEEKRIPVPACGFLGLEAHAVPAVQILFALVLMCILPSWGTACAIIAFHVVHEKNAQEVARMPTAFDATEPLTVHGGGRVLGLR